MRSYTVIGTGAIGGYYGVRLHQAGFPVRFLARSDADHVRAHGLRVDSPDGDAVVAVEVYDDPAALPPSDTVIVATKTTDTDAVAATLAPMVAEGGSVLVMQNGLGVDAPVSRAVPEATVLGAMCFMCCHKVGPGHIHHLDQGAVTLGEYRADGRAAGVTPLAAQVVEDLRAGGVRATAVADLETGRWHKLVWNMAFNGLSVTLDADTATIMADPESRQLAELVMHEVVDAARACGRDLDEGAIAGMLDNTASMEPYLPSMKLDYDAGRPLELDAIYAAPIAAARAAGTSMPRAEVLLAELRRLDAANRVADLN